MKLLFLFSILIRFLFFQETVSYHYQLISPNWYRFQAAFAHKNITLDRSIDQMLLRIESAVKKQNLTEFETYFAPKFDSECAWKFIEMNGQTWKRCRRIAAEFWLDFWRKMKILELGNSFFLCTIFKSDHYNKILPLKMDSFSQS